MTPLLRAALLLALLSFLAPAVAAQEEGTDDGASDGTSEEPAAEPQEESAPETDGEADGPVEDVEDCMCNGTEEGEAEPDPIEERATCPPTEIDPYAENPFNTVQVDPDGCWGAAVKKALQGQPPIVRNVVCLILERIP
jgi:hypothetical protein